MYDVIGIRFKKAGKVYYFDPGYLQMAYGDFAIVETARGVEYGKVVIEKRQVEENDVVLPLKKVIRVASKKDKIQVEENKVAASEAFDICLRKIGEHGLKMKLVDAEYTFDRNKMIFYFTADGRVDFRELVKNLASVFRTRIELRQIGVRDEAKLLGGIGPCGRLLCCSTFLGDFEPVSIKMAKDQNLSLNPAKISGVCGRLMCCLKYENDEYETAKQELPDIGEAIETSYGRGRVTGLNLLERLVQVKLAEQDNIVEYTLDELIQEGALST
ncbi:MAG TPA: stage 0 sporulation family protein [Bacillales bacterium]|nr:stage 0 sporulation family protein [Bacillales bacterium]